jgi:hypothetical protein
LPLSLCLPAYLKYLLSTEQILYLHIYFPWFRYQYIFWGNSYWQGCKLEFWHNAIDGIDTYDTNSKAASVFIKYYNKTNNSVILYNDDTVDRGFNTTAVICPYYIDKWIVIGVVTGSFVLIFVALFSVYFILINLYDRWEYQRFLEESKDIFETGKVTQNPISRGKSRLSVRNIRNRLSRMSVRPS